MSLDFSFASVSFSVPVDKEELKMLKEITRKEHEWKASWKDKVHKKCEYVKHVEFNSVMMDVNVYVDPTIPEQVRKNLSDWLEKEALEHGLCYSIQTYTKEHKQTESKEDQFGLFD